MKLMAFFTVLYFTVLANSAPNRSPEHVQYVMCKNQKIVRTLRIIEEPENKGCQTMYTKAGIDRVVGVANSINGCQAFLENVKGNLEKAAWKCKDISQTRVTYTKSAFEKSE